MRPPAPPAVFEYKKTQSQHNMSPGNKKKHSKAKLAASTSPHTQASPPVDTVTAVKTKLSPDSPPDMSSPTRVAFRDFIELADVDTINIFLAATTATSESENLELLWKHAYKEGFENGQKAIQAILQRV